jgi:chalcone isomerase-like protein
MRRTIVLVLVSALLGGVGVAHARECLGVAFSDQATVGGSTLTLNGLGVRLATFLKLKVYVAALYVAKTSTDPNAILEAPTPKQLILHFVRAVGRSDLNAAWEEGFEANSKAQLPALARRIDKLKSLMTDRQSGDRLIFTHESGVGVRVSVGAAAVGTIEGDDFAKALLSIWLGPHPPNPEVKAGLLGGPCG